MHTPDVKPSLPADACASTGPPTTFAATATAAPMRALRRMTMSLPRDAYERVHGMRAPIASRGPVPYCAPGGSDDGPRAPLAQERDPRTAAGSRAASDPAHPHL